jgi:hypothetical protein
VAPKRAIRVPPEEFQRLDLEVHDFLADVPLRDVSRVELPGGGPDRTLADLRPLLGLDRAAPPNRAVRALFALRAWLGQTFGCDRDDRSHPEQSYLRRVSEQQRARSLVPPGTKEGPFRILYELPLEQLGEVRNATVHAFSCMTLRPTATGYLFYWAIYVKPVSRLTPIYMAMIEPFRRFVVYPALLRRLRYAWARHYGATTGRG